MDFLRTTRVTLWTPVTSFREPFVVVGSQQSHNIPPPSTVYGLCCSVAGERLDPTAFFFGVHFTFLATGVDLEHQHIAKASAPATKTWISTPTGPARATTEISVQPVTREFLFGVTTTLYVDPSLAPMFRQPANLVTFGRSQDLTQVIEVLPVTLQQNAGKIRLEHTLLPRAVRPCVRYGSVVLLSKFITENPERKVTFDQYVSLHEPVFLGDDSPSARSFVIVDGMDLSALYHDPTLTDDDGFNRGVWIHRIL